MNIMGMGWQEMMIILVGALLIFGPDRLPEVAGQIGKFVRDLRKMTGDLTGELERNAGVGDIKKAVQGELAGIKGSLEGATSGVNKTVAGASSSVKSSVNSATTAAKSATAAKSTTVSSASTTPKTTAKAVTTTSSTAKPAPAPKPVASKKDPLADVSFFEDVVVSKPAAVTNGAKITTLPSSNAESSVVEQAAVTSAAPANLDALGRARQRRQAAGYNRASS